MAKTAVFFPRDLLVRCDSLASRGKTNRDALVAQAPESLLKRCEAEEITRKYNEVCSKTEADLSVVRQIKSTALLLVN